MNPFNYFVKVLTTMQTLRAVPEDQNIGTLYFSVA